MTAQRNLVVVDLGAESGRVFLARYDGARLSIQEIHRFPNRPVPILGHLHWNIPALWQEILTGLQRTCALIGALDSIGIDSWAVDYGLLDAPGQLLGLPFHYRDTRTEGMMEQVFTSVSREALYDQTGIQFLPFNTLYQLVAHSQNQPGLLAYAERLLMIPDLFHYWLSGERVSEYTNATTTQLWSVPQHRWLVELLEKLNLPPQILPPVVQPGTDLGPLMPDLAREFGTGMRVITPATHDTASAIAAIPANDAPGWAYISSGTWSLVGLELSSPLTIPGAANAFTNEGGIFSTVRYLRNVMGLWLIQECRNTWAREGTTYSYEELMQLSQQAPALGPLFNPDEPIFLTPGNMPMRIEQHLISCGQEVPETPGAFVRCILESLTLRYRQMLELASTACHISLQTVHIVGGGAKQTQQNQWLANATGLTVVTGPIEAAVVGNALLQLVGLGEIHTLSEVRHLSRTATQTCTYTPEHGERARWDEAYARFLALECQ